MVHYDCTEKEHYVPIPRSFAKKPERKSCFIDRNRVSTLSMKFAVPLVGDNTKDSARTKK